MPDNISHEIDAEGKSLGRIASQAAVLLRGKGSPDFERHVAPKTKVVIKNARLVSLLPGKAKNTYHVSYSGYPGGQKFISFEEVIAKHGHKEVLRRMIRRMLPANRLRNDALKNLTITD